MDLSVLVLAELGDTPVLEDAGMQEILIDGGQFVGELNVEVFHNLGVAQHLYLLGQAVTLQQKCHGVVLGVWRWVNVEMWLMLAQQSHDRADALAALQATTACGIHLGGADKPFGCRELPDQAIRQRVADADIQLRFRLFMNRQIVGYATPCNSIVGRAYSQRRTRD